MLLDRVLPIALGAAALVASSAAFAGGNCVGPKCYRLVATPAEYSTVAEQVMVSPERRVKHVIPAEYGLVEEAVTISAERTVTRRIPAVTEVVAEQVEIAPARKVWQVTRKANGETIGCWVKIPAQYGVHHRTVVVQPERFVQQTIPAVQGTRTRKVLVKPADVVTETIPAVYETRHRSVLVRPASRGWQPVGAGY